jgi:hypothetical protein
MSRIEHGYQDYEEDEPLWAIDEDELSLIKEVILGQFHTFDPSANVDASEEGVLSFNSTGATWYDTGDISNVDDPKILIYLTTNGNKVQAKLVAGNNIAVIDLE